MSQTAEPTMNQMFTYWRNNRHSRGIGPGMPSSQLATIARDALMADDFDAPAASGAQASPITDPRLREAHDYWRSKVRGRAMPRRADLDPTEIPQLLPDDMLVDVLPQGRYRYRLIGTENTLAQGMNATGRYLDEVIPIA